MRIHPTVDVQSPNIGEGTPIWRFAVVLPGAMAGAGAVVTRDVSDRAVVAGNPARVLRYLE